MLGEFSQWAKDGNPPVDLAEKAYFMTHEYLKENNCGCFLWPRFKFSWLMKIFSLLLAVYFIKAKPWTDRYGNRISEEQVEVDVQLEHMEVSSEGETDSDTELVISAVVV